MSALIFILQMLDFISVEIDELKWCYLHFQHVDIHTSSVEVLNTFFTIFMEAD